MGIVIKPKNIKTQTNSMISALEKDNEALRATVSRLEGFAGDNDLQGNSWGSLKRHILESSTVLKGMTACNDYMIRDSRKLANAVGSEELIEDDIDTAIDRYREIKNDNEKRIEKYESNIRQYGSLSSLPGAAGYLTYAQAQIGYSRTAISIAEKMLDHLRKKLEKITEIERDTKDLYSESKNLQASVDQGIAALNSSWNGTGFDTNKGKKWLADLENAWNRDDNKKVGDIKGANIHDLNTYYMYVQTGSKLLNGQKAMSYQQMLKYMRKKPNGWESMVFMLPVDVATGGVPIGTGIKAIPKLRYTKNIGIAIRNTEGKLTWIKGGKYLSNYEARKWYLNKETTILKQLNKSASLKSQAKKAFKLRNQYRTKARLMMKDWDAGKNLFETDPNMTWKEAMNKQIDKGFEGREIYKEIIKSSQRSRPGVNIQFGLD
ncbi:MAG: hypothetical protein VB031_01415 [Eubacteriaceae bacterium]|nr:hypothetical protein [Eubacteriaceae bacterium]